MQLLSLLLLLLLLTNPEACKVKLGATGPTAAARLVLNFCWLQKLEAMHAKLGC